MSETKKKEDAVDVSCFGVQIEIQIGKKWEKYYEFFVYQITIVK